MQNTALNKALALALGALLVTACSSKGDVEEGTGGSTTAIEEQAQNAQTDVEVAANDAAVSGEENTSAVSNTGVTGEALEAQAKAALEVLKENSTFYFDFDQSDIKSESKTMLRTHASYLSTNSGASVVLEGFADDRGTVEYNLALGERRAVAVRRFLMANGASADQISVVSYGEERPVAFGQNEASWAKNRRVEIKY